MNDNFLGASDIYIYMDDMCIISRTIGQARVECIIDKGHISLFRQQVLG